MLTCREFINFIADYLAGTLSQNESHAFAYHLADCPECSQYLSSYQTTVLASHLAYADPEDAVPAEVPEELVHAILSARAQSAPVERDRQ
ncbi:MAG: hypothetical protein FJ147_08895 [Deltaproteobacteria bacterium]|nr:hypothetical protein [Deltaproteobacteria bacterium]